MEKDRNKRDILFNEAARFLTVVSGDGACPICGCSRWSLYTHPENEVLMLRIKISSYEPGRVSSGPMKLAIGAECKQCAFVRLHAWVQVVEWLENNQEPIDGTAL